MLSGNILGKFAGYGLMDAIVKLEITDAQRDLLVEGLRFVRSARKLAFRDKFNNPYPNTNVELTEVSVLLECLGKPVKVEAAK
jgi:hypothetical protein